MVRKYIVNCIDAPGSLYEDDDMLHKISLVHYFRSMFGSPLRAPSDLFASITPSRRLYPQWKSIKILLAYFEHQNEEELQKDKEKFDRNLGTLEPFLESAVQVSS